MSKLKPEMRVNYETAKNRALRDLRTDQTCFANSVAIAIWPDHQMTSQGAGAAASRILKRMEKEGLCRWKSTPVTWGWIKTKLAGITKGSAEYFDTVIVDNHESCSCIICSHPTRKIMRGAK